MSEVEERNQGLFVRIYPHNASQCYIDHPLIPPGRYKKGQEVEIRATDANGDPVTEAHFDGIKARVVIVADEIDEFEDVPDHQQENERLKTQVGELTEKLKERDDAIGKLERDLAAERGRMKALMAGQDGGKAGLSVVDSANPQPTTEDDGDDDAKD